MTHEQAIPCSAAPVPPATPDEAVRGAPAASEASAPGSKPQHRRPFLDQVLDDHFAGRRRAPLVDQLLHEVDTAGASLTLDELLDAAALPRAVGLVHRLVARGVLEWKPQRHRTVLVRPAAATAPAARRVTRLAAAQAATPSDRGPRAPRP